MGDVLLKGGDEVENDRIEIYMNDFMKNAGIVGLECLLKTNEARFGSDYGYDSGNANSLWIRRSFALNADWTSMYFTAMVKNLSDMTTYARVSEKLKKNIELLREEKELNNKDLKDDLKFINDKLLSNSYKNGFENIKDKINKPEIYEKLKKNKVSEKEEKEVFLQRLEELKDFLEQDLCKETFVMKSLAYTYINRFWDGRSFLLRSNAKKDMKECFEKDFSAPLLRYWSNTHEKAKELCIDCGKPVENKEKISIAFMTDAADDLARKRSAFWNCKVDAYLCPECAFVYALAPLGFQLFGNKSIFLNTNSRIQELVANNSKSSKVAMKKNQKKDETQSAWISKLMNLLLGAAAVKLQNIQVILKSTDDKEHYVFQIINKEILTIFKDSIVSKKLEKLAEHPIYKIKEEYVNVYEKVFFNIMEYKNQYRLINYLLKQSLLKEGSAAKIPATLVFDIQTRIEIIRDTLIHHVEGGKKVEKRIYVMTSGMCENGYALREKMQRKGEGNEAFEERIRGTVYQLLNALSVKNKERFFEIAIRLYTSLQISIPKEFSSLLKSEEQFQQYGYAFILGLKGSYYDKDGSDVVNKAQDSK